MITKIRKRIDSATGGGKWTIPTYQKVHFDRNELPDSERGYQSESGKKVTKSNGSNRVLQMWKRLLLDDFHAAVFGFAIFGAVISNGDFLTESGGGQSGFCDTFLYERIHNSLSSGD